ncbi:hypothetical protein EGX06_12745 [Enterococcus hirae]|nr:hypothetical protein CKY13_03310 [Enterococcus hirae]ROZ10060.1 hypothetical protein EGX06_12745 [Enterococcus hirae]
MRENGQEPKRSAKKTYQAPQAKQDRATTRKVKRNSKRSNKIHGKRSTPTPIFGVSKLTPPNPSFILF